MDTTATFSHLEFMNSQCIHFLPPVESKWQTETTVSCINLLKPSGFSVPPGSAFNSSTLCPHSVFVCFVWLSSETVTFALLQDEVNGFYNGDKRVFTVQYKLDMLIKHFCFIRHGFSSLKEW